MHRIVFVADHTDSDDLALVFNHLERLGVSACRKDPGHFTFIGGGAGRIRVLHEGLPFKADLVVGWVFENWLVPGVQILEGLSRAGFRVLNTGPTLTRGQNKFLMSLCLAEADVSHGRTVCAFEARGLAAYFEEVRNVPHVIKPGFVNCGGITVGASAEGPSRIEAVTEAQAQLITLQTFGHPIYAQTFFNRPRDSDIRVWLFGDGQFEAVRKVPAPGIWNTNTSRGITHEHYTPPHECMMLCRKAADAIGTQIAGLDVAETEEGFAVLEVNTCPTFRSALPLLGETVPQKLAAFLQTVLNDLNWRLT